MPPLSKELNDARQKNQARKRARRRAVVVGIAVGLICHFLPSDFAAPCQAVAKLIPALCGL